MEIGWHQRLTSGHLKKIKPRFKKISFSSSNENKKQALNTLRSAAGSKFSYIDPYWLTWLPSLTSDLPHHDRLAWAVIDHGYHQHTCPALLAWEPWDCPLSGEDMPCHLTVTPAPELPPLVSNPLSLLPDRCISDFNLSPKFCLSCQKDIFVMFWRVPWASVVFCKCNLFPPLRYSGEIISLQLETHMPSVGYNQWLMAYQENWHF